MKGNGNIIPFFLYMNYKLTVIVTWELVHYEARIRQPCGVSVCRTRGHTPDTRQIRVRYATWLIVDHIVG